MTYRSIRGIQLATFCLNGSLEHDEAHLWLSQGPTVIVSQTGGLENIVVLGKLGFSGKLLQLTAVALKFINRKEAKSWKCQIVWEPWLYNTDHIFGLIPRLWQSPIKCTARLKINLWREAAFNHTQHVSPPKNYSLKNLSWTMSVPHCANIPRLPPNRIVNWAQLNRLIYAKSRTFLMKFKRLFKTTD